MEKTCLHYSSECPLWVISGSIATTFRLSAFGGKADLNRDLVEGPLIARNGHEGIGYLGIVSLICVWIGGLTDAIKNRRNPAFSFAHIHVSGCLAPGPPGPPGGEG